MNRLSYGKEVTYTLNPKEVLILQFGEKDETPAKILSVEETEKKQKLNLTRRSVRREAGMFKVDGYE